MPTAASDARVPRADVMGARLREARSARGIGVRELARRVGVTASMISQMERGAVMPSVATLYAIVRELELSLDGLFRPDDAPVPRSSGDEATTPPGSRGDSPVQRAGARRSLILDTGVTWELLAAREEPNIDFLYATYPPGSASAGADRPSRHGGREYGIVQRGRLGVTIGDQTYELGAGDSIAFDATLPHRVFAIGGQAAEAIWFATDRRSLT